MLLPVVGLIQVGSQAHADRYTYLPQIGLYILITWAVADLTASRRQRGRILAAAAAIIVGVLSWRAWVQTSYWRDSETLFSHALAVTSNNDVAENNLGIFLKRKGRLDEAITHLQTLVKEHPNDAETHYNLGNALLKKGDSQSAIAAYEKAISIKLRYPDAHYNLGIALDRNGQIDEAIAHYQQAVREDPHYAEAYYLLGNDFLEKARTDDAIAAYEQALKSRPAYPEVQNNIGFALLQKGRPSEAIAHWQNALAIQSDSVDSLNNLAWILATFPDAWIRNGSQALTLAERANQLSGNKNPAVLRTLAAACAENGRFTEARVIAERGFQLANAQEKPALANILEGDIALYRINAPVRTGRQPDNSSFP